MSNATDKTVTVEFNPNATSKQSDIIPAATPTKAGCMSSQQAAKLDSLTPTPPSPPTQFSYLGRTVEDESVTIDTYTVPPDSSAWLMITVSVVSDFFSRGGSITATVLAQRNGSGNGDVNLYTLTGSVLDAALSAPPISIQAVNLLVNGVLQITLNGKAGRTIDWTVTVQPYIATQGQ